MAICRLPLAYNNRRNFGLIFFVASQAVDICALSTTCKALEVYNIFSYKYILIYNNKY